jgi:hypothetical protein
MEIENGGLSKPPPLSSIFHLLSSLAWESWRAVLVSSGFQPGAGDADGFVQFLLQQ